MIKPLLRFFGKSHNEINMLEVEKEDSKTPDLKGEMPRVIEAPPNIPLKRPDYRQQGQARGDYIAQLVQKFALLKTDQIIRAVRARDFGLPDARTDYSILKACKRLSEHGYFHQLGRYRDGRVVYGIHKKQNTRPHFDHDLKVSAIGLELEIAGVLDAWVSDQTTLKEKYKAGDLPLIPDATLTLQGSDMPHYVEMENNQPNVGVIKEKLRRYRSHRDILKSMRVLYICARPERVPRVRELAGDGMLVWVTSYNDFIQNPLGAVWTTGANNKSIVSQ